MLGTGIAFLTYFSSKKKFKECLWKSRNSCSNLIYLSTIACKVGECLTEEELTILSADLVLLGDMFANILAQRAVCSKQLQETEQLRV